MEEESEAAAGSKRRRVEEDDWTIHLDYRNKYGYRRYSIESAQLEAQGADSAYVPFKVRAGERGETEIHIVVNDRIIAAAGMIEEYAKRQALRHAPSWFGRSIEEEEIGALFKSSLRRDERYPTKLKARAGQSTIIAHTTLGGDTSSGQGAEFLADMIKTQYGLQGLQATGSVATTTWMAMASQTS